MQLCLYRSHVLGYNYYKHQVENNSSVTSACERYLHKQTAQYSNIYIVIKQFTGYGNTPNKQSLVAKRWISRLPLQYTNVEVKPASRSSASVKSSFKTSERPSSLSICCVRITKACRCKGGQNWNGTNTTFRLGVFIVMHCSQVIITSPQQTVHIKDVKQ